MRFARALRLEAQCGEPQKPVGPMFVRYLKAGDLQAILRCPRHESNMRTRFRKPLLYPLSYGGRGTLCPPARRARISRMSDTTTIADLLHEPSETHPIFYPIVTAAHPTR